MGSCFRCPLSQTHVCQRSFTFINLLLSCWASVRARIGSKVIGLASQGQKVRLHTRAPAHANGATNRWLSAACGAQGPAKMMAKNVVRLRKQQEKLYKGRAQLSGVSQMTKSAAAQQTMMKGAAQTQL